MRQEVLMSSAALLRAQAVRTASLFRSSARIIFLSRQIRRSLYRRMASASAADGSGGISSQKAPCFSNRVPPGDERERLVCDDCGHIDYKNPKIVVSAVAIHGESVLLCRRGIEPRRGFWGIPQGFLELGETLKDGAAREAREEAGAEIQPGAILAVYEVPGIVQICFLSELVNPNALESGIETLETRLFTWDELPASDELAFPTVEWALNYARTVLDGRGAGEAGRLPTFIQPEQRVKVVPPGSQPFGNTTAGAGAGSAAVSGVVVAAAAGEGGASRTAAG